MTRYVFDTNVLVSALLFQGDIRESVEACRDPKDDQVLELAVNGRAGAIITGDTDLLALNPFRGIPIITPAEFLRDVG